MNAACSKGSHRPESGLKPRTRRFRTNPFFWVLGCGGGCDPGTEGPGPAAPGAGPIARARQAGSGFRGGCGCQRTRIKAYCIRVKMSRPIPAVKSFDRRYWLFPALNRRAETSGFLRRAALAAAPVRAPGRSQSLVPQVSRGPYRAGTIKGRRLAAPPPVKFSDRSRWAGPGQAARLSRKPSPRGLAALCSRAA